MISSFLILSSLDSLLDRSNKENRPEMESGLFCSLMLSIMQSITSCFNVLHFSLRLSSDAPENDKALHPHTDT